MQKAQIPPMQTPHSVIVFRSPFVLVIWGDEGMDYWFMNTRLYFLARRALRTGESLDQLFFSTSRILDAKSNGSLSQRPNIKKSSVTPNRSTKSAANASVMGRLPPSKRDQ